MKSARDRAIDIAWAFSGKTFSRDIFLLMMNDKTDTAESIRKMVEHIERGIEDDRRELAAMRAPS